MYAGELHADAQTVTIGSGKPIFETWIVVHVAGGRLRSMVCMIGENDE